MLRLKLSIPFAIFAVLAPFWAIWSFSQTAAPDSQTSPPLYSSGPVTPYDQAEPNLSDVLRFRRGERYNSPNSPLPPLGEDSDAVLVVEDMGDFFRDPLPFDQSDAVVVVKVTAGQSYLSNDKRDLYSEFNAKVQKVLKAPQSHNVQPSDNIALERQGGTIRLPSGKLIVRGSKDFSMPLIGKRYLFFLRFNPDTEDFHIVTGYQLEGQHIYRLDELDYAQSDRHHDKLIHPLRQESGNEEQFLGRVRAKKQSREGR